MDLTMKGALSGFLAAFLATPVYATLIDRGDGLIYDDVLDITWLQDAGLGGEMNWFDAVAWADSLVFGGFDDWRLPSTTQLDPTCSFQFDPGGGLPLQGFGVDCIGSEMGHLHNVDGVSASNQVLFEDIQPGFYWSATEFEFDARNAWMFLFPLEGMGGLPSIQMGDDKQIAHFAWAVRDGDVLAAAPEPSTLFVLGTGLIAVTLGRRRR